MHKDKFGDDEDFLCGEPYYKSKDDKKIPVYGNYIEELFLEKKNGVLAARGLFRDTSKPMEIIDKGLGIVEVTRYKPNKEEERFTKSYQELFQCIIKRNLKKFKSLSLDKINVMDSVVLNNNLSDSAFNILFRENMLKKYPDFISFSGYWSNANTSNLLDKQLKKEVKEKGKSADKILIMGYNFSNKRSKKIAILFKKLNNQYKFFGYDSILFPIKTSNIGSYYVQ